MQRMFFLVLVILSADLAYAQAPQGLNYQAVARDITGQLVTNRTIAIELTVLQGGINGTVRYNETQSVTTNDFGLFTLVIGMGTPAAGNNFSNINWGAGDFFLRVGIDMSGGSNYITTSTTQLMSVPYALYADKVGYYKEVDGDTTNELQTITKSGTSIILSKNGGTVVLNDDDPTNELQSLSKNGKAISLTQGNTIYLVDDDTTNELQTITKTGSTISLSKNGGSVILFDDDPTNELQTITRIPGTDSITLSQFGGTVSIKDGDADSTNELQVLTRVGSNITLSKGGGTVSVNDADADSTNELQTFSQNGMVATLSKGGGSVLSPDTIVLNYIICVQGAYPGTGGATNVDSAMIGEIKLFAGNFAPNGWLLCQGQVLPINQNTQLYSVLGTIYGGNGTTTFAIPDLRRRIPVQH